MSKTLTVRTLATALGLAGLFALLTWPLFVHPMRTTGDFSNDVWLIANQADALRERYSPSYFAHLPVAAFYPVFAFYGGTLFAFAGAVSLLVGSAAAAATIVCCLALAAAYGGWLWLARMAGLRSWLAHVPAVLYVTAPYVLSNLYVRSDLPEFVATAMIPLLVASTLSVLRADRLRAGPAAALAVSTIGVSGSHNITLLWATTILGLTALLVMAGVPQARRLVSKRGMLRVLAVAVPAMAVNAWYLVPDLAFHTNTVIAHRIDEWRGLVRSPGPLVDAKYLFALGRPSPFPGSGLTLTLPVLAMAWVLVAAVVTLAAWRQAWWRIIAILALVSAAVVVTMRNTDILLALPDPWVMIQFSYRIETFVLFGICGAVIAALVLLGQHPRRWLTALLIPIMVLSVIGAARQMHRAPLYDQPLALVPHEYTPWNLGDYADAGQPVAFPGAEANAPGIDRSTIHKDRVELTTNAGPGEVIYTNIMTSPQMIDVQGASVVGRWELAPPRPDWQPRWYLALRIDRDATPGQAHVTIREGRTLPIVSGRIISLLGLLGLAASAATIARGAWRRRTRHALAGPALAHPPSRR